MMSEQELGERIATRPDRFDGEPYLIAAEVRVADVLRLLARGQKPADVFSHDPGISQDDLLACLEFTRLKVEAAIGELQPENESKASGVDWKTSQSRHGVSDDFVDAARDVFEQHDEILRRLA